MVEKLKECDSPIKMSRGLVVDFNKLVKVRFSDGDELLVRIFENSSPQSADGLPINKDAPLGKAILGHTKGEQIEYTVRNNTYKVTILEVYESVDHLKHGETY